MSRIEYIKVEVTVLQATSKAVLLDYDKDAEPSWVPRAALSMKADAQVDTAFMQTLTLSIATWKADELGWTASDA